MTPLDAALAYAARGWCVIPIPPRHKGSKTSGWHQLRLSSEMMPSHFGPDSNVGVILGPPSAELVDIDLDCPEAIALTDIYLPPTGAIFGRPIKPRSHRLYVAPGAGYEAFSDPISGEMLLELRAQGRDGGAHQTLFPPSIADGEQRVWCNDVIEPARIDARVLRTRLGLAWLAIGCLVFRNLSETAARDPRPDFPRLLWEFDHQLGRVAYRWSGQPSPDAPRPELRHRSKLTRKEIDLAEVVHAIRNDCSWEEWNKIGLAIFAASSGSDQGYIVFDDFSAKSHKYNAHTTAARWAHYHRSPPSRIGAGTLVYLARQHGWRTAE
jgi:hypothetical protein